MAGRWLNEILKDRKRHQLMKSNHRQLTRRLSKGLLVANTKREKYNTLMLVLIQRNKIILNMIYIQIKEEIISQMCILMLNWGRIIRKKLMMKI